MWGGLGGSLFGVLAGGLSVLLVGSGLCGFCWFSLGGSCLVALVCGFLFVGCDLLVLVCGFWFVGSS